MQTGYLDNALSALDYNVLRQSVGWSVPALHSARFALEHSLYVCSAHDDGIAIGAGRIVGDGLLAFAIMDVMVRPDYQHRGVGAQIVLKLLDYLRVHAAPESDIYAMSVPEKTRFYQRLGFILRPTSSLGPGMSFPYEQLQGALANHSYTGCHPAPMLAPLTPTMEWS